MQKPNPVIKNYIMSSDVFVLDDNKSKHIYKNNSAYQIFITGNCLYYAPLKQNKDSLYSFL